MPIIVDPPERDAVVHWASVIHLGAPIISAIDDMIREGLSP